MGLFVSSKKEKETWASIVLSGIKPGMQIDDALLEKVADIYINQHGILMEALWNGTIVLICVQNSGYISVPSVHYIVRILQRISAPLKQNLHMYVMVAASFPNVPYSRVSYSKSYVRRYRYQICAEHN